MSVVKMMKILFLLFVLIGSLFARFDFTIPFPAFKKHEQVVIQENILAVSWQKGFCAAHPDKRVCRRLRRGTFAWDHFTLHGLWPEVRGRSNCSNRYEKLDKELWKELEEKMPAARYGLAKHEWIKHGICYGKKKSEYFKDSLKLLDEVNSSPVRDFFVKNQGRIITKQALNRVLKYPRKVQMICEGRFITELRFSLKGDIAKEDLDALQKDAKPLRGGCQKGKIASY